jgi:hypothetical protein
MLQRPQNLARFLRIQESHATAKSAGGSRNEAILLFEAESFLSGQQADVIFADLRPGSISRCQRTRGEYNPN